MKHLQHSKSPARFKLGSISPDDEVQKELGQLGNAQRRKRCRTRCSWWSRETCFATRTLRSKVTTCSRELLWRAYLPEHSPIRKAVLLTSLVCRGQVCVVHGKPAIYVREMPEWRLDCGTAAGFRRSLRRLKGRKEKRRLPRAKDRFRGVRILTSDIRTEQCCRYRRAAGRIHIRW